MKTFEIAFDLSVPLHPMCHFQPPTGSKQLWVMINSCLWCQTAICEISVGSVVQLHLLCSSLMQEIYIHIFILGAKSQEVARITELLQWGGISCGLVSNLGLKGVQHCISSPEAIPSPGWKNPIPSGSPHLAYSTLWYPWSPPLDSSLSLPSL